MLTKHQERTFPAQAENLASIRGLVNHFFHPVTNAPDSSIIHDLIYAVDEACANIIGHGSQPGDEKAEITLTLNEYPDNFEVVLKDNAPRYNPLSSEIPEHALHFKFPEIRGLGIYMMKKLADEITYEPTSINKGNKLTFVQYKSAECLELQPFPR
jgi:serine/threonine-protein kinase RsbW